MTLKEQFEMIKQMADSDNKAIRLQDLRSHIEMGTDFYKEVNKEYWRICHATDSEE